jgi:hypothetical protein
MAYLPPFLVLPDALFPGALLPSTSDNNSGGGWVVKKKLRVQQKSAKI